MGLVRPGACSRSAACATASIPTDAAKQVEFLCSDSRSVYLFVEDDEQLDKYLEVARPAAAGCGKVIVFDMEGLAAFDDPQVISLEQLRELGRST